MCVISDRQRKICWNIGLSTEQRRRVFWRSWSSVTSTGKWRTRSQMMMLMIATSKINNNNNHHHHHHVSSSCVIFLSIEGWRVMVLQTTWSSALCLTSPHNLLALSIAWCRQTTFSSIYFLPYALNFSFQYYQRYMHISTRAHIRLLICF